MSRSGHATGTTRLCFAYSKSHDLARGFSKNGYLQFLDSWVVMSPLLISNLLVDAGPVFFPGSSFPHRKYLTIMNKSLMHKDLDRISLRGLESSWHHPCSRDTFWPSTWKYNHLHSDAQFFSLSLFLFFSFSLWHHGHFASWEVSEQHTLQLRNPSVC